MREIILVIEGSSDFAVVTKLAERVLQENIKWLDENLLSLSLRWRGIQDYESDNDCKYSTWKDLNDIEEKLLNSIGRKRLKSRPRYIGRKKGKAAGYDYPSAHQTLRMVELLRKHEPTRDIAGVVLFRDLDNQAMKRRESLESARKDFDELSLHVVIGTALPSSEAWILNGFVLSSHQQERDIIEQVKKTQGLTFNPCTESHRITPGQGEGSASRRAKEIRNKLVELSQSQDRDFREEDLWEKTDLQRLRQRGMNTRLTDYLREIEERLVPAFK
jgi:hypothetical protein